mmetsp:Transcript_17668/g.27695  ORF Transcript_17668/g.27695 Transcript_17668/m.27695 type:complete len:94 (+) Transcript_17668:239-520(+)
MYDYVCYIFFNQHRALFCCAVQVGLFHAYLFKLFNLASKSVSLSSPPPPLLPLLVALLSSPPSPPRPTATLPPSATAGISLANPKAGALGTSP